MKLQILTAILCTPLVALAACSAETEAAGETGADAELEKAGTEIEKAAEDAADKIDDANADEELDKIKKELEDG